MIFVENEEKTREKSRQLMVRADFAILKSRGLATNLYPRGLYILEPTGTP